MTGGACYRCYACVAAVVVVVAVVGVLFTPESWQGRGQEKRRSTRDGRQKTLVAGGYRKAGLLAN